LKTLVGGFVLANQDGLGRLNLFEGIVIGIYGNWLISFVDKLSFGEVLVWYQPLCIFSSFFSLLLLFAFSIFRPRVVTRSFGFLLGFCHVVANFGALYAEGLADMLDLKVFYWLGVALFLLIYIVEIRRVANART
jgi:hypothetical protein